MKKMPTRMPLKVTFKGNQYEGEYEVEDRIVKVFFEGRSNAGRMMTRTQSWQHVFFL